MTASTSSTAWTVIGIVLNAVGVIFLFRFGMPYSERRSANVFLVIGRSSQRKKAESAYELLSWLGLCNCIRSRLEYEAESPSLHPRSFARLVKQYHKA